MADAFDQIQSQTPAPAQGTPASGGDVFDQIHATSSAPSGPTVKPGASDEDIIRSLGFDPAVIKTSPRYQAAAKAHGSGLSYLITDPNGHGLQNALGRAENMPVLGSVADIGEGGADVLKGLVQLARHGAGKLGLLSDADVQYGDVIDQLTKQDYLQNVRHGNSSPLLQFIGRTGLQLGMLPQMEAGAGAGLGKNLVTGAVNGGAAGLTEPVDTGNGQSYVGGKAGQLVKAAATGAAFAGTVGLAGRVPGAVRQFRATQLPEQAVEGTVTKLRAGMEETPWGSINDVENVAKGGGERSAQANMVLKQVQGAETPRQVMQASESLQHFRAEQLSDQHYATVDQIASQYGAGTPTTPTTMSVLGRAEMEAQKGLKDAGLNSTLAQVRKIITPEPPPAAPTGLVDPSGRPIAPAPQPTPPPGASYAELRKLSSQIDEIIRDKRTAGNELVGDRSVPLLRTVQNAINQDLAQYAQNSKVPELQLAAEQADNFYRDSVVPFKDTNVSQTATADETDGIYKRFIRQESPDRALKFYNALDPKGQAAVQYQMMLNAANKATDPVKGFDSGAFTRNLKQVQDAYGVFFQGQDRMAIDGMRNFVLQAAKVDANPASAFGSGKGGIVSAIPKANDVLKYAMTTPGGRRFLYMMAGLEPGLPIMQDVMGKMETAAAKWAVTERQQPVSPTQP